MIKKNFLFLSMFFIGSFLFISPQACAMQKFTKNVFNTKTLFAGTLGTTAWALTLSPFDIPHYVKEGNISSCIQSLPINIGYKLGICRFPYWLEYIYRNPSQELLEKYFNIIKDKRVLVPRVVFEELYEEMLYTKNVAKVPYYKKIKQYIFGYNSKNTKTDFNHSLDEFIFVTKKELIEIYCNLEMRNYIHGIKWGGYMIRSSNDKKKGIYVANNKIAKTWCKFDKWYFKNK